MSNQPSSPIQPSSQLNPLVAEIQQTGFLLETKVAALFEDKGSYVEQNLLLNPLGSENLDRMLELDILATRGHLSAHTETYIVECKGAGLSDRLVLIPRREAMTVLPRVYFEVNKVKLNAATNIMCDNRQGNHPWICHNGDFFSLQPNGKYQRSSKQDDRNTLFKGLTQLQASIEPVLQLHGGKNLELYPMIVTNAQIHVAKFDLSQPLNRQITTAEVPWAAFTNPMTFPSQRFQWEAVGGTNAEKYAEQRRIPVVWIVNFDYLSEFIDQEHKVYRKSAEKFVASKGAVK